MKYRVRANKYVANNCVFCPETLEAWSYGWWQFVAKIGGLVVFNSYRYSSATAGHQAKVRRLLGQLGIKIDVEVQAPAGLQNTQHHWRAHYVGHDGLASAVRFHTREIEALQALIAKPRSRKSTNAERLEQIKALESKIALIEKLLKLQSRPNNPGLRRSVQTLAESVVQS